MPNPEEALAETLARARTGDRRAIEGFCRNYGPAAAAMARRLARTAAASKRRKMSGERRQTGAPQSSAEELLQRLVAAHLAETVKV